MAIKTRDYGFRGRRSTLTVLEACPCGYQFDVGECRAEHISTHDPEDFGLSQNIEE